MPTNVRARGAQALAALLFGASVLLPAAGPAAAADPMVLRVGTTQDLDSTNPYQTALVSGYETFQLTYNLLVDFGPNLEPVPGFADSWQRSADGTYWTFHIRDGMKWSDGQPATSADACFSFQLDLDAIKAGDSVGLGYIDPNVKDAGITKVECPDPQTMIAYSKDPSERILQTYVPILPKHIYGKDTYKTIADEKFTPPLVGTGPYTATDWKQSQYVSFTRNPYYWGQQGYEDQIVIQFFKTDDTMVQALKAGELDYARDPNADQLKSLQNQPGYQTVVGTSNGWTQLAFNTYGTGGSKPLKAGDGPSTQALLDPAFRDALGYAVDKQTLIDKVLGGFGTAGDTVVPPALPQWHVTPDNPRHFDIQLAIQKLEAAGYKTDANGNRLDKQGKPIVLRLDMPDSDANYPKTAQFIQSWYGQLGIKVVTQVLDSATLSDLILPSNGAKYDIELWGWAGNPDPNALLQIFRCDAIGNTSDSQYCNPAYDKLYDQETAATSNAQRHDILAQMQNLIYDQAPYDVLYYDSSLAAYRTDRFAGWTNQPSNGTPFFTYSTLDYTKLTNAAAAPSPTPVASEASSAPSASTPAASTPPATPAPSAAPSSSSSSSSLPVALIALVVVVVVVVVVLALARRRGPKAEDE